MLVVVSRVMGPAARVKGWEFVAGGTSSRARTANGPAVQTSKTPKMTKQWKAQSASTVREVRAWRGVTGTPLLLVLDLDATGLQPPASGLVGFLPVSPLHVL